MSDEHKAPDNLDEFAKYSDSKLDSALTEVELEIKQYIASHEMSQNVPQSLADRMRRINALKGTLRPDGILPPPHAPEFVPPPCANGILPPTHAPEFVPHPCANSILPPPHAPEFVPPCANGILPPPHAPEFVPPPCCGGFIPHPCANGILPPPHAPEFIPPPCCIGFHVPVCEPGPFAETKTPQFPGPGMTPTYDDPRMFAAYYIDESGQAVIEAFHNVEKPIKISFEPKALDEVPIVNTFFRDSKPFVSIRYRYDAPFVLPLEEPELK